MLAVERVNVYYGESHILRDVSLSVNAGEVLCLLGRNGVGKTTVLKTIMGLLAPRSGSVRFRDEDVTKLASYHRARRGIGYAPQGREIFPYLTVQENLMIGLEASREKKYYVPPDVFELFPILKEMLKRKGGDLSGGMQQQLAIARALVARPTLLLLDEPTEGIQPSIILEIEQALRKLKARGDVAILLVEQYLEFAGRLADHFCVMQKGEIVSRGPIQELTKEVVHRHLAV